MHIFEVSFLWCGFLIHHTNKSNNREAHSRTERQGPRPGEGTATACAWEKNREVEGSLQVEDALMGRVLTKGKRRPAVGARAGTSVQLESRDARGRRLGTRGTSLLLLLLGGALEMRCSVGREQENGSRGCWWWSGRSSSGPACLALGVGREVASGARRREEGGCLLACALRVGEDEQRGWPAAPWSREKK